MSQIINSLSGYCLTSFDALEIRSGMLCNQGWWNLMSSKNIIFISVLVIPVIHWHCHGFDGAWREGWMEGWDGCPLTETSGHRCVPTSHDSARLTPPPRDSAFLGTRAHPGIIIKKCVCLFLPGEYLVFGICPPRGYDNQVRLLIPSWRDLKLAADISVVTVFPASSVLNLTSHTPSGTQS